MLAVLNAYTKTPRRQLVSTESTLLCTCRIDQILKPLIRNIHAFLEPRDLG